MTTCPFTQKTCDSGCELYINSSDMCAITVIALTLAKQQRPFDDVEDIEKKKRKGGKK